MRKTLLFLGGAEYQVPAIRRAVDRGYRVIVCGYRPDDPGNRAGHEYRNVSISDTAKIADLAKEVQAELIVGYVSETAVNTAARVSEMLGLPGCPVHVLETLSNKNLFRNFQKERGFNHPKYAVMEDNEPYFLPESVTFPFVVKPTDSCGSRGVSRVDREEQFLDASRLALSYSSKKSVIVEEVVGPGNQQITGDGFMKDGELYFFYMANHIYTGEKNIVAVGTSWPASLDANVIEKIKAELEAQLWKAGYINGPVNADIRIGGTGEIYIIEAAPRFGANYMPQIIRHCTGVDLLNAFFDRFEGTESSFKTDKNRYVLSLILLSKKNGILKEISLAPGIKNRILKKDIFISPGSAVQPFRHLGNAIGVLILSFDTRKAMDEHLNNLKNLAEIKLEPQRLDE